MTDEQVYELYVEHIWNKVPEVYRDELEACEAVILAGIKAIVEYAIDEHINSDDHLGEDQ